MRVVVGAALTATMAVAGTCAWGQPFPRELIETQCEAEWPDDLVLQFNCVEKQETAFDTLAQKRLVLGAAGVAALAICESRWPADFPMQSFCLDVQTTPGEDAVDVDADISKTIMARVRGRCEAQWPNDFSMQVNCIEERSARWRETYEEGQSAAKIVAAPEEAVD